MGKTFLVSLHCPVHVETNSYTSRVEVMLKTVYVMMGLYCHINDETMVSFKPIFFLQRSCFSVWWTLPVRPSEGSPLTYSHSSKYALFMVSPVGIHKTCSIALCGAYHPFHLSKSAGVAPLSPCSRKLLDVTVKVLAVFFLALAIS